jgi:hypothetical protein
MHDQHEGAGEAIGAKNGGVVPGRAGAGTYGQEPAEAVIARHCEAAELHGDGSDDDNDETAGCNQRKK